jgi:microcystin-dependent protein
VIAVLVPRSPPRSPPGVPAPPRPPLPAPCSPLPVGVPVGSILAFAGEIRGQATGRAVTSTAPFGWMVCDGRQLHRAQYPELFAAIGYRYARRGESPGVLYRLPDLQGYFLRGVDPSGVVDPDNDKRQTPAQDPLTAASVGSVQKCALQVHEHDYVEPKAAGTTPGEGSPVNLITAQPAKTTQIESPDVLTSDKETRPVNVAVYYLIRFTNGAWPWTAPLGGAFGE